MSGRRQGGGSRRIRRGRRIGRTKEQEVDIMNASQLGRTEERGGGGEEREGSSNEHVSTLN